MLLPSWKSYISTTKCISWPGFMCRRWHVQMILWAWKRRNSTATPDLTSKPHPNSIYALGSFWNTEIKVKWKSASELIFSIFACFKTFLVWISPLKNMYRINYIWKLNAFYLSSSRGYLNCIFFCQSLPLSYSSKPSLFYSSVQIITHGFALAPFFIICSLLRSHSSRLQDKISSSHSPT